MFINQAQVDFITPGANGITNANAGEFGEMLGGGQVRFDPGFLRPYLNKRGVPCVTFKTGEKKLRTENKEVVLNKAGEPIYDDVYCEEKVHNLASHGIQSPVFNATVLRKDDWIRLDRMVVQVARQRLRAWADLAAANPVSDFDGMSTSILEHETASDPGSALVDMDGVSDGENDIQRFQLEGTPLPITHSGFTISERKLMTSRNQGVGLDLSQGSSAVRRVAETVEKTTIGVETGIQYGKTASYGRAPKVYGYTNFPDRVTKTDMTAADGTNGPTVLSDWLALRDALYNANHYGPFMAYTSNNQDKHLDNLFSSSEPSAGTLRARLLEIDNINAIRRLDYLNVNDTTLLVEMTRETAEAIIGMNIQVVQWESKGGMQKNFKVMGIMVPRLRADFDGNCGIAHGTTS